MSNRTSSSPTTNVGTQQQRQQQQQPTSYNQNHNKRQQGGVSSLSDTERRIQELQYEQYQLQQQLALEKYASTYETVVQWPARIVKGGASSSGSSSSSNQQPLRTSKDLVQHRLIENGILYDIPITTSDLAKTCNDCIADLQRTDCYDAIQIDIGVPCNITQSASSDTDSGNNNNNKNNQQQDSDSTTTTTSDTNNRTIRVTLHEKKWYRFHAGAGLKSSTNADVFSNTTTFGSSDSSTNQFIPLAEMDISAGIRNITGYCDKTDLQYTMDTKGISSWSFVHNRPLYSLFPNSGAFQDLILSQNNGSQYEVSIKGILDTIDYEYIRGYQEYQRLLSCCICNIHNVQQSSTTALGVSNITKENWFTSLEWNWLYRDIIPRRSTITPYQFDTSNPILQMAGPSMKHSLISTIQYASSEIFSNDNNSNDNDNNSIHSIKNPLLPTDGYIINNITEVALPPGDVGYIKTQLTASKHIPLSSLVSIHTNLSFGYIRALSYGGLLSNNNNNNLHCSDRFYIGGTNNFRGFVPGGIGPRAFVNNNNNNSSSSSTTGDNTTTSSSRTGKAGNALGGDFYSTTTFMASTALPDTIPFVSEYLSGFGIRLFTFTTIGTLTNMATLLQNPKYYQVLQQSQQQQQQQQQHKASPLQRIRYGSLVHDILYSSRISTGIGLTTTAFGPKIEVTYSIPVRYGPYDGRKLFQFGMSMSL